jgi:hypothetical protein
MASHMHMRFLDLQEAIEGTMVAHTQRPMYAFMFLALSCKEICRNFWLQKCLYGGIASFIMKHL